MTIISSPKALRAALLACACMAAFASPAFAQKVDITFLHINDVYEISARNGKGGFAELKTVIDAERAKARNSLLSLGGDLFGSSMMSGITKGEQMVALTNAVGVEIAVPGNHEFDFGPDVFVQRVKESKYPWIATNMMGPDGKAFGGTYPYAMQNIGGLKFGFFGLITPDTTALSSPGPNVKFTPYEAAAREAVKYLKSQGADIVVALTHLTIAEDRELARKVKDIDVILGGHDHDPILFYENSVVIMKAGYDAHYLGAAEMTFEKKPAANNAPATMAKTFNGMRFVPTAGARPDPQVAAVVKTYEDRLDAQLKQPVGVTQTELDSRRGQVRRRETAMGNLIADAVRDYVKADLAIVNGGGIRGDKIYAAGATLTRRDVANELPFTNTATLTELKGADILAALENGVSDVENNAGRFPQISGMTFTFDARRPKGQRVLNVTVGGRPLDTSATYRVATNDYMLGGGDGYAALSKGRTVIDGSGGMLLSNVVMAYIEGRKTVAPRVEGRITERD